MGDESLQERDLYPFSKKNEIIRDVKIDKWRERNIPCNLGFEKWGNEGNEGILGYITKKNTALYGQSSWGEQCKRTWMSKESSSTNYIHELLFIKNQDIHNFNKI